MISSQRYEIAELFENCFSDVAKKTLLIQFFMETRYLTKFKNFAGSYKFMTDLKMATQTYILMDFRWYKIKKPEVQKILPLEF